MENILDLNDADDQSGLTQLSARFNDTDGGGMFEVTAQRDLRPLLNAFQESNWGSFNWFPLKDGPETWLVSVNRLPQPQATRQVREFMTFDHRRCDDLYAQSENAANGGDQATAIEAYNRFELGMIHHFRLEEEGFFPAFERTTGMTQGPTMVMRMEHEQMRGIMKQMRQAADNGDMKALVRGGGTLLVLMQQHNLKEEQMLYAMGDMHLGQESDNLLKEMQRM
ncbi:MAG: hemerythrin domain-containing protein [Magnetococcales bacterium]|nr:hemerythrin domain-containing protein [Magnetococcales bacterium]